MTRKGRIGVFGGTFNPVHRGHVKAAAEVLKKFRLEQILFVPARVPPHKRFEGIAPAKDRMRMVELALRGRRRLVPSPIEIRARGTSYSIRTLAKLKKLFPGARIFFILGVDAFLEIETWKEWRKVLKEGLLIVMTRPGFRLNKAARVLGADFRHLILAVPRTARFRETWLSRYRVFLLPIRALKMSSTEIRAMVRTGRSLHGWVEPSVERYVQRHGFYRDSEPGQRDTHG